MQKPDPKIESRFLPLRPFYLLFLGFHALDSITTPDVILWTGGQGIVLEARRRMRAATESAALFGGRANILHERSFASEGQNKR